MDPKKLESMIARSLSKDEPDPSFPEFATPKRYTSATAALFRLRKRGTEDFRQVKGVIYKLDPKDTETITVHGGHRALTFSDPLPFDFFDNWDIVSVVELWS